MGTPWELRHPSADLARRYRAAGWWTDDTLSDIAFNGVVEAAASSCRVRSQVHPFTGRIGDLGDMGRRLAGGLTRRGIVAGDVVAFQLPNWAEFPVAYLAIARIGPRITRFILARLRGWWMISAMISRAANGSR